MNPDAPSYSPVAAPMFGAQSAEEQSTRSRLFCVQPALGPARLYHSPASGHEALPKARAAVLTTVPRRPDRPPARHGRPVLCQRPPYLRRED